MLHEEIWRLLYLGVIEVGQSDYASSMTLVESSGKEPLLCVDYRKLNAKTRTEHFPLSNIEEVAERVSGALYHCYGFDKKLFSNSSHGGSAEICGVCDTFWDFYP